MEKKEKAQTEKQESLSLLDNEIIELNNIRENIIECLFKAEKIDSASLIDYVEKRRLAFSYKEKKTIAVPIATLLKLVHLLEMAGTNTKTLKELLAFKRAFIRAVDTYRASDGTRTENKRTAFFKELGITKISSTGRGKRHKKINKEAVFYSYARLVHPVHYLKEKPLEPRAALELLKNEYGLHSPGAVAQAIRSHLREYKKRLEAEGREVEPKKYSAWVKSWRIPRNP